MKKWNNSFNEILLMFLGFLLMTCSPKLSLQSINWLEGTWELSTSRGSVFEQWVIKEENELFAESYLIKGKDTIILETVQILQNEKGIYYIPTVKNQNKGKPIQFSLRSLTKNEMVFENQEHDFPQVIAYKKVGKDSLVAEISGNRDGKIDKRTFPMKKIN